MGAAGRGRARASAGAVAPLYQEIGGQSLYFGKPHAPIYDLARKRLEALGKSLPKAAILAIGDGAQTDISGARDAGIDALFITGGLAAQETLTRQQPYPIALADYLDDQSVAPAFSIGFLRQPIAEAIFSLISADAK